MSPRQFAVDTNLEKQLVAEVKAKEPFLKKFFSPPAINQLSFCI